MELNKIKDKIDTKVLLSRPLPEWCKILCEECQVYVCEGNYIAKRVDEINYKFCSKEEAEVILEDNLYTLLKYKYFQERTEQIDERIQAITKSMLINLKSNLIRVTFDKNCPNRLISYLPDYCCAFRNGVYDFKNNKWFFKYEITELPTLSNHIYSYNENYVIMWYFNLDFQELGVNINEIELSEFVDMWKELTKTNKNYCFELMYNMAHDMANVFDIKRFEHLCEICGYLSLQSFSQHMVLLIGSGQNGKNSLFDGCFTNRLRPAPSALDLESIEEDKFATGTLENTCHNIFLETAPKSFVKSNMIKALTGSMNQSINHKGVSVYSGIINCKYIFAGNDRDNIKFKDNTVGFRRRVNLFEIYYQWDPAKKFLKRGDYYDTSFSDDLHEIKDDLINTLTFVYFAMFGIKKATNNFTQNFKFTYNEWNITFEDVDLDFKETISNIGLVDILRYMYTHPKEVVLKDFNKKSFQNRHDLFEKVKTENFKDFVAYSIKTLIKEDADIEEWAEVNDMFTNNSAYLSLRCLQSLINYMDSNSSFTKKIKQVFHINTLERLNDNLPFVKIIITNGKIIIKN